VIDAGDHPRAPSPADPERELASGASVDLPPREPPQHRARAVVGFLIGLALFGAAVWTIATGDHDFEASLDAARHAPWWLVAGVLVLPIANWLVVSESFRVLTGRYARVGRAEMAGLIASAWLLNYLPMKPGMFGRLAYHKHVNKVRYADSARVLAFSVSLTAVSLGLLVVVALLVHWKGPAWVWCSTPAVVLAIGAFALRNRGPWAGRVAYGALLRYIDSMIWVGRYAASFALVGSPLSFADSVTVAAVSQVALLIPVSGNGLGVREWGVRLVTSPAGLLADVVNRAAEIAIALPVGIAGTLWSVREVRKHRAATHPRAGAKGAHASAPPSPVETTPGDAPLPG
jgi:hypothetical protein